MRDKGLIITEVGDITTTFTGDGELAADTLVLFDDDNISAVFSGGACRHHPRGTRADHQNFCLFGLLITHDLVLSIRLPA